MQFTMFNRDARYFQMAFQLIFLCYGIWFLQWSAAWLHYTILLTSGLLFHFVADSIVAKRISFDPFLKKGGWKSVLISCFSLCLLLKTNSWIICIAATAITIFSKYLFKINGRHIFNPSALGIAATVYITGQAWISPGQWGSNLVLFVGIISLGFIIVTRVQQLDITIAFFTTYALLLFIRYNLYLGWPVDFFVQSVSTGSLLLFSFFMISDPKTSPDHSVARVIWAVMVACISFYLSAFKYINGAPIWVLVCTQPLVPLFNYFLKAKSFEWKTVSAQQTPTHQFQQ